MDRLPIRNRAAAAAFNGEGYIMQPRINLRRDTRVVESSLTRTVSSLLRRSSEKCHDGPDYNTCDKGVNTNITNIAIILGVVIPVVAAVIVLIFLHRRNVKRLRLEDAQDPTKGLDFGMGDAPNRSSKRKSFFRGGEKGNHKGNQLSMDMNLSSPYLLPPSIHQSRESVHSMARNFHNDADPYRTVAQYTNSETGSIRSFNPKDGNRHGSIASSPSFGNMAKMPPSRSDSMPKTPLSATSSKSDPFATPKIPEKTHLPPLPTDMPNMPEPLRPVEPIVPEIGTVSYPDEKAEARFEMPEVQEPPATLSRESHYEMPSPPFEHDKPMLAELPAQDSQIGAAQSGPDGFDFLPTHDQQSRGLGLDFDLPHAHSSDNHAHAVADVHGQAVSYDDYDTHGEYPQIQTSQYYEGDHVGDFQDDRGRPLERQAPLDAHEPHSDGLAVPQKQLNRLSVGFRPLPPDEVMESEDPEYRANRIRSFYKEYFDDKEPAPPMPGYGGGYYEDYDANYLGDAAYYDADTNAFVMPYAQPVTRRAMTPPPAGRRGPGGPGPRGPFRGGPRGHGSIGGMSLPGGPRRPRAGSALSPRPGSSASAQFRGTPRKRLPPPADLVTLPTPSKLRDDSAIFNASDFAPPDSFREQVSGRSQSPLGERRAYQPKLPVASPLVTAFDELSALPSPHLLRKSSTFTGLDFAPPKKFKDPDTMSDAGSIRSNRSGISAVQLNALRGGAGRISRLPGDTVFTSAALNDTLKPQWGMRP